MHPHALPPSTSTHMSPSRPCSPPRSLNFLDLLDTFAIPSEGEGSLSFSIPACHTLSTYKHPPFASSRSAVQISSHSWRILSHTSLSFYGDISRIFVSHSRIGDWQLKVVLQLRLIGNCLAEQRQLIRVVWNKDFCMTYYGNLTFIWHKNNKSVIQMWNRIYL